MVDDDKINGFINMAEEKVEEYVDYVEKFSYLDGYKEALRDFSEHIFEILESRSRYSDIDGFYILRDLNSKIDDTIEKMKELNDKNEESRI